MVVVLLIALIFIMLLGFVALFISFNSRLGAIKDDSSVGMLKQDLQGMSQQIAQTQEAMHERLDRNNSSIKNKYYIRPIHHGILIATLLFGLRRGLLVSSSSL